LHKSRAFQVQAGTNAAARGLKDRRGTM